jgi:hypothetical protein
LQSEATFLFTGKWNDLSSLEWMPGIRKKFDESQHTPSPPSPATALQEREKIAAPMTVVAVKTIAGREY